MKFRRGFKRINFGESRTHAWYKSGETVCTLNHSTSKICRIQKQSTENQHQQNCKWKIQEQKYGLMGRLLTDTTLGTCTCIGT